MKNTMKATVLALALMGGAAHAQSTPGSEIDISVSVGSQCSLVSKSVADLSADGDQQVFRDDDFSK